MGAPDLIDRGGVEKEMERTLDVTFLASALRSIRFGTNEAHGRGEALQRSFLLDRGAVAVRGDGTFMVVDGKVKPAVRELTALLLTLQAEGDRAQAKRLLAELEVVRPPVQRALDRLAGVPVDREPIFVTAHQLVGR